MPKLFTYAHPIIWLAFLSIFICLPILIWGLPYGGDPGYQSISYFAFKESILSGEIFPNWLPNVNNGLGGANFFFIPPFVYYLAFFIDALSFFQLDSDYVLCITQCVLLYMSGLGFYALARHFTSQKQSFILSLVYMTLPFHFWFEVYERSSITSFAAYIFVPLIILAVQKQHIFNLKYMLLFSVSYALLILSHIPSTYIATLLIALYGLYQISCFDSTKVRVLAFLRLGMFGALGIGLSAFYLLPIATLYHVFDTSYIWSNDFHYSDWFLSTAPPENCKDPYVPRFLLIMFFALTAITVLNYFVFRKHLNRASLKHAHFILACIIFSGFLMLKPSFFIWEIVPGLMALQFPWRFFLTFEMFIMIFLLCIYTDEVRNVLNYKDTVLITAVLFALISGVSAFVVYSTGHGASQETIQTYLKTKRLTFEHIPVNDNAIYDLDYITFMKDKPEAVFTHDQQIDVLDYSILPRHIYLNIKTEENATVNVRQFHIEGWRKIYNEEGVDVTDSFALRDEKPFGQMAFDVPPGHHKLTISMPLLIQEKIGFAISFISLLALIALIVIQRHKQ